MSDKTAKRAKEMKVRDKKKLTPDRAHVPPHKKERQWRLTAEWEIRTTHRYDQTFTTKAARDDARIRLERAFRDARAEASRRGYGYAWWNLMWGRFSNFRTNETHRIETDPVFAESYEELEKAK